MTFQRISALALAGVLTLGTLTACAPKSGGESTPPPTSTPPTVTSTPAPTDLPIDSEPPVPTDSPIPGETNTPTESVAPSESAKPSATATPSAKPSQKPAESAKPSQKPSEKPSATPAPETSVVQSVWGEISGWELPALMDLDATLLSDLYGISSGDLVEYVAKMPMMSANVTEMLIAKCAPGKVDAVKKACEARQATLAADTLYPESTRLVEDYKLVVNGDYIIFCIDEKAADMVETFNKYAK